MTKTMTPGMVERVARAICRARLRLMWPQLPESSIDAQIDLLWRDDIEGARAAIEAFRVAIEAFRVASPAMLAAINEAVSENALAAEIWGAAVDAALSEEGE